MLEGELSFQLAGERYTNAAAPWAVVPRGVAHTFANLSGADARALIVCPPAGFERCFARVTAEQQGADPPAWALQDVPEVTIVGPPIGPTPPPRRVRAPVDGRRRRGWDSNPRSG